MFGRLGYKLADAIADLIDNSIDARAKQIHIRFLQDGAYINGILIADNGSGMTAEVLEESMRFGSKTDKSADQLGKYGVGMKTASLSQARKVTVLTRHSGQSSGMRWRQEQVQNDWTCELLDSRDADSLLKMEFPDFKIGRHGTLIIWQDLEHLRVAAGEADRRLQKEIKLLKNELGIRFHRFLSDGRLSMTIDQYLVSDAPSGIATEVTPLDPFAYGSSPVKEYPLKLQVQTGGETVIAECHIWPAKSNQPGYKLGGGMVAERQGFYFYRNDRLIQAGGWNGLRGNETEPHLSLARVRVELPASLDSLFKLQVTKMGLDPAPEFLTGIQKAVGASGKTYDDFISDALSAYGRKKAKENARFPVVPGSGISAKAQKKIRVHLKEKGTDKPREVSFKWASLDPDELFRIEPGSYVIKLNTKLKKQLVEGDTGDAPVLKVALMFLLQPYLQKAWIKGAGAEWLQKVNQALISAL